MLRKILLKAMIFSPLCVMLVVAWQMDAAMKYPSRIQAGNDCLIGHKDYQITFRNETLCVKQSEKNAWDSMWNDINLLFIPFGIAAIVAFSARRVLKKEKELP
jgi:putative effector of murein hydrolase LrgA (UPF0299 family)